MKYKITLELDLSQPIAPDRIESFLYEQWEQTAAAMEGDLISSIQVEPTN